MPKNVQIPVLVGTVPLLAVTSLAINEEYKATAIAGSSLIQQVSPTEKTINIEALLIREARVLRLALESLALASRRLAGSVSTKFSGIPVVAKTSVHLDMQITKLVFAQDNQMRDTLRVSINLTHVPRSQISGLIGGLLDVGLAAGSAFI
jgi:hypothetical protein